MEWWSSERYVLETTWRSSRHNWICILIFFSFCSAFPTYFSLDLIFILFLLFYLRLLSVLPYFLFCSLFHSLSSFTFSFSPSYPLISLSCSPFNSVSLLQTPPPPVRPLICLFRPNVAVRWSALLLRIWEIPVSNLGQEPGYSADVFVVLSASRQMPG